MIHHYPHPDRDGYPAHAGPPAFYPAEADVPPAWTGDGRGAEPVDFTRETEPEEQPFPEPLVCSTGDAEPPGYPAPVLALRARLEAAGWRCLITYAEGWMPHATTGRPGTAPRASLALRMRRAGRGAVAVYRAQSKGWAWDLFYTWSPAEPWQKHGTLGAFEDATLGVMVRYPEPEV